MTTLSPLTSRDALLRGVFLLAALLMISACATPISIPDEPDSGLGKMDSFVRFDTSSPDASSRDIPDPGVDGANDAISDALGDGLPDALDGDLPQDDGRALDMTIEAGAERDTAQSSDATRGG
ncbi:MAG: hypothetical protein CSA65_03415 [Proteobacteria bacterium]|nr:MAG: hypothetical protein CSA65_03415 [Pseudomonadota bacterium]